MFLHGRCTGRYGQCPDDARDRKDRTWLILLLPANGNRHHAACQISTARRADDTGRARPNGPHVRPNPRPGGPFAPFSIVPLPPQIPLQSFQEWGGNAGSDRRMLARRHGKPSPPAPPPFHPPSGPSVPVSLGSAARDGHRRPSRPLSGAIAPARPRPSGSPCPVSRGDPWTDASSSIPARSHGDHAPTTPPSARARIAVAPPRGAMMAIMGNAEPASIGKPRANRGPCPLPFRRNRPSPPIIGRSPDWGGMSTRMRLQTATSHGRTERAGTTRRPVGGDGWKDNGKWTGGRRTGAARVDWVLRTDRRNSGEERRGWSGFCPMARGKKRQPSMSRGGFDVRFRCVVWKDIRCLATDSGKNDGPDNRMVSGPSFLAFRHF